MNKRKFQAWLPLLFSIVLVIGMYLGYVMRDVLPGKPFFYTQRNRPVQEILDLIKNKYVDEVDINALGDTAIKAILAKLDPHTDYFPASEVDRLNEELAGSFYGIGIEYNLYHDTINVVNVLKDGPSEKAGLATGDKILKIGDSAVTGRKFKIEDIRKLFRGSRGSKISIALLRGNEQKTISVARDMIPQVSIDARYMLTSDIGYIKLNRFSQISYREFMEAMDTLHIRGMKKLVLDLRGNGGGVLDQATSIADEFLDGPKMITYTEGKHSSKKEYHCQKPGVFEKEPLVVLTDEGSASASEVLTGALQDWDRATIIGRRSFGKGLVLQQFDLSDGSAIRMTVSRYYTPAGRSLQRPYSNGETAYNDEVIQRFHDGEVSSADSIPHDPKYTYKTLVKGRTVYGGGGITPDIFIPFDTLALSVETARIYSKGTVADFCYFYFLQHQQELRAFGSPTRFNAAFQLTESDWQQFVKAAAEDSIDIANISPKEKASVSTRIKATLARQVWRIAGYFEVLNVTDDAVLKAIEVLK